MTIESSSPSTEQPRLWLSTILVSSMTMLSRVMGFIRDMAIAQCFGAGAEVDAFLVAFKIPSFMRRLFAEGAFSQAFVPVLSEYRKTQEIQTVRAFIQHMAGVLSVVLLIVSILAMLLAPWIVRGFAPGFAPHGLRYELSSHMLVITFPYLLFISIAALCAAVLNTYDKFGVPAFTPVLLNIMIIVAALWGSKYFHVPIMALAWAVFFAGILQFAFQLPFIFRLRLLVFPKPSLKDPAVRRVLKLMVPAIFGVSVAQINILIDTIFASVLPIGSVSWLYYSDRLSQFPLGVFGVAIATVILPHLSRKHAEKSSDDYNLTLNWAIRCILFLGIPAAIGLFCLAGPILATLFNYGAFNSKDVLMSAKSLRAFAIGIPAFMLIKILAAGFYARQDIKTPVKVAVLALITNTTLNFILIFPLAHAGLALSTSIAAWLNAGCLAGILLKRKIFTFDQGIRNFLIKVGLANVAMVVILILLQPAISKWLAWGGLYRGMHLLFYLIAAVLTYFAVLLLTRFRFNQLKHHRTK